MRRKLTKSEVRKKGQKVVELLLRLFDDKARHRKNSHVFGSLETIMKAMNEAKKVTRIL